MAQEQEVRTNEHGDETHPAFGVAVVTRGQGTPRSLFQSDLMHNETIALRIETATRGRDLNHDWVHPDKTIVEVEMSLAQWGALVSSIGIGSGVPVTIRRTVGEGRMPDLPYEPRIAESAKEVRGAVRKMMDKANDTFDALKDAIEGKKGAKAVRDALRDHGTSLAHAESNAEFAVTSMDEAAEKVASQARADIEAHVLNAARATGLDRASIEVPEPKAIEAWISPDEKG